MISHDFLIPYLYKSLKIPTTNQSMTYCSFIFCSFFVFLRGKNQKRKDWSELVPRAQVLTAACSLVGPMLGGQTLGNLRIKKRIWLLYILIFNFIKSSMWFWSFKNVFYREGFKNAFFMVMSLLKFELLRRWMGEMQRQGRPPHLDCIGGFFRKITLGNFDPP